MKDRIKTFFIENKFPIQIFILSKTLLILISIIAVAIIPLGSGFEINTENRFLNLWSQWDGEAYLKIAENGYVQLPDGRNLYNFLPLYPFFIKLFELLIGNFGLAAFLISNIASFIAIIYLYKFVKLEFGEKIAGRSVVSLLFFPTAFFLTAVYSESIFLMFLLMSVYYLRIGNLFLASILAFFLPLIRIGGIFFFIPFLYHCIKLNYFTRKSFDKRMFYLIIPFLGVLVLFTYFYIYTGNPLSYLSIENTQGFYLTLPVKSFINFIELASRGNLALTIYSISSIILVLLFLGILVYSVKKKYYVYALYQAIFILPPLFSSTLQGFSRFVLLSFPSFIVLALLYENRKFKPFILLMYSIFIIILIFLTARFVTGVMGTSLI